MTTDDDPELAHLEAMHASALALCATADPLLRGQYEGLLGRITALLTIRRGTLPDDVDAVIAPAPSGQSHS